LADVPVQMIKRIEGRRHECLCDHGSLSPAN
jgi:hypothetical protein